LTSVFLWRVSVLPILLDCSVLSVRNLKPE
jgi:hypothetical protein